MGWGGYGCGRDKRFLRASAAFLLLTRTAPAAAFGVQSTICLADHDRCTDSVVPQAHGLDEPSLVFYSDAPGSGNSLAYLITLPKDPPESGGRLAPGAVVNSQLFESFWFGMALCDSQSAPETATPCVPDSDANIYDNPDPAAPDYIGKHPGTAYMELQFYPPGTPFSLDNLHWDATLAIFSVGYDQNHGVANNPDCVSKVGLESVNAAHVTRSGVSDLAAGPLGAGAARADPNSYLAMNPGDTVSLLMHDTSQGFQAIVVDLTTGERGSMTAGVANGFSQIRFDPDSSTCTSQPYSFHPMYSTAGRHTRVPWAVHSYNLGFVVEIGQSFPPGSPGNQFDSYSYLLDWPGTGPNPAADRRMHPQPIRITSPLSSPPGALLRNYQQAAFEANLPGLESTCDESTSAGCTNPPDGALFYPIFTTGTIGAPSDNGCTWQFGGGTIPGTTDIFGGWSATEYVNLLELDYPGFSSFADFNQVLDNNPCAMPLSEMPRLHPPAELRFPPEEIGATSAREPVAVTNRDRLPVLLSSVVADGDFTVTDTNCVDALPPGSTCYVDLTFSPQLTGTRSGWLTISDNAINSPQRVRSDGKGKSADGPG